MARYIKPKGGEVEVTVGEVKEDDGKIATGAYVVACASYFPLLGIFFGIIALLWVLFSRRKGSLVVATLATGGIAFTILVWSLIT